MMLYLRIAFAAAIIGVFLADALFGVDWEVLSTKHYWDAGIWYYGGYARSYVSTPRGNRNVQREGLTNYSNLFALQETLPPAASQHHVQGFPGTERLLPTFLLYLLIHLTGKTVGVLTLFWISNVLLWLACIFLTQRLASYYFADDYSPWIAGTLVAFYPALTLTFSAIKQQPLGTVFFLAGVLIYEKRLRRASLPVATTAIAALILLGLFANGGGVFLAAYIFFSILWERGRPKAWPLITLGVASVIAKLWFGLLNSGYHLPSVTETLHIDIPSLLAETKTWIAAWLTQNDISNLRFLGYPGTSFFTYFLSIIMHAFLTLHAPLLLIAMVGLFLAPKTRMLVLISIPLFFLGHGGTLLAGWRFHYGYLSFPAGMMIIFAASGTLGLFAQSGSLLLRSLVMVTIIAACLIFSDLKTQAGVYYGGFPERYQLKVIIRYPDDREHLQY
jgi:hypothetical protein